MWAENMEKLYFAKFLKTSYSTGKYSSKNQIQIKFNIDIESYYNISLSV